MRHLDDADIKQILDDDTQPEELTPDQIVAAATGK